ncbi:MAG: formylglycine-generating enzyme family protein [Minicystis sp.]
MHYTDVGYPATVSSFRLDRFEVTVGRFRHFVNAVANGWRPVAGAGKHTHLSGGGVNGGAEPGWDPAWNAEIAGSKTDWDTKLTCDPTFSTWTPSAAGNEKLPMNCLSWYDAHAFCIWDGGFLPTEAEWNYAAADGSDQQQYPWGTGNIDGTYAAYNCLSDGSMAGDCTTADILEVGSKSPQGDGKWNQADLAGGVWEWNLDFYADPYPMPCDDCAELQPATERVLRGGAWGTSAWGLLAANRNHTQPTYRDYYIGVRCARAYP